ncbi:hypothetical protein GCM10027594_04880 [Hymenobacter agri]
MLVRWREHLPPAPELPRSLWLTGGGTLLALLSYGFRAEVWPSYLAVGDWSLAVLPVGGLWISWQLVSTLLRWLAAITGPWWLLLLSRVLVAVIKTSAIVLATLVALAGLFVLALLA